MISHLLYTLWTLFNEIMVDTEDSNSEGLTCGYTAEVMVEMYLKEPVQSRNTNPLEYWKEKKSVWQALANLSCKYLTVPASSASS